MDRIYKQIGRNIKTLRKNLGLTQEKVAERCNIDASFFGQVERGATVPSINTLVKISKVFRTIPKNLFPGETDETEDNYIQAVKVLMEGLNKSDKDLVVTNIRTLCKRLKK